MAYAVYDDVVVRYPYTADYSQEMIDALLDDAAAEIDAEMAAAGIEVDQDDPVQVQNLLSVSCSMVARVVLPLGGIPGVSSFSQMAGPVQMNTSYANPTGDMYMTAGERRKLGISAACGVQLYYGSDILGGGENDAAQP